MSLENIDDVVAARKIARRLADEAASRGEPIAGMLAALENVAAPCYLGLDVDPDDSDLEVFP